MPMVRARALCPRGCYVRPRMARYREVSTQVFAVFHELTPLVEGLSLDEAFLDVTGSLRLFGSREAIGQRIRERILAQTGLQASVGMAHNKFLAKLASDAQKPAGFVSVDPLAVQAFLDPMPIKRLWGIGRKTEPLLRAQGWLTIGQLRRANPLLLREVLGNRAGHFLALARGEDEREVMAVRPDKSISHEVTFDDDLLDPRALLAELLRQSEAVARRLRHQHLAARTVQVKIRDRQFRTMTRSLTLRMPSQGTRTIYQAGKSLLSRWLRENHNTPVRLLGIGVSGFEEEEPLAQKSRSVALDVVLDSISERFGADKAVRGLGLLKRKT
jgi:DNA polymerase-4